MKIFGIILAFLIFGISLAESEEERQPSMFKVGDDWLALPEVFSNLDFGADNTPAGEEDIEGQMRLRSTRFWGRLYIDGWPQTIQFFRAHFGIEPPIGRKRFIFPEPRDGCQEFTNSHLFDETFVLLVNRGNCTFGTKAKNAVKTKASGLIIVNNEPGLEHLPGPDAHDINFSIVSIPQQEGQLLEAVYDEGPSEGGLGRRIEGYVVPINCENSGARCQPATVEERRAVKALGEGGSLQIIKPDGSTALKPEDSPIEYLLAHFGVKIPHNTVSLSITMAKPPEACTALENDVKGKVVLVRRGTCAFVKKAEEVQNAGGRVMVLGGLNPYLVRMGVEPRWKGLNTGIPVIMVSKRSYSVLLAESYLGGKTSFFEDHSVNSTVWEELEKLSNGEGWPRSEVYVDKKYEEMNQAHSAWPDRLLSLKDGYSKIREKYQKDGIKSEL